MKNTLFPSSIRRISVSQQFHIATKLAAFPKKDNHLVAPESWKVINYKAYPRLPQILLPSPSRLIYDLISALIERRSTRDYRHEPITMQNISDLLYYSLGIKGVLTKRPAVTRFYPSAGARYPLEIYPLLFNVLDIPVGGYHYNVKAHSVELLFDGFTARKIYRYIDQPWIKQVPVIFLITAVFDRTVGKYGSRGYRHILTEYGHLAQNIYLMAAAQKLGCCSIGGFLDENINRLLDLDYEDEGVVGFLTIGKPALHEKQQTKKAI